MRPSSPRSSRISSTTARYSVSSSRIASPVGSLVRALVDLDEEAAARVGLGGAGDGAVEAVQRPRRCRRPAAAPCRSPRRRCRPSRTRPRAWARAARALRHRRRSVRVTFMLGKTTMSSRGTSKSLLTVGSRSSEPSVIFGHTSTNYKKCTGIPDASRRLRAEAECLRNAYKPPRRPRVSVSGARISRISPPGAGHRLRSRTPRARPRTWWAPAAGVHSCRSSRG